MATAAEAASLAGWLEDFADCVRRGDYDGGRALFDDGVVGFGTRTAMMRGLDDLQERQWRHIWDATRGFAFDPSTVVVGVSGAGDLGWAVACWSSEGRGLDGAWFPRRGRASFTLKHDGEGWRCVHSHHSLDPTPEALGSA